jgi:hypothetical protein
MSDTRNTKGGELLRGLLLAHAILFVHILLIAFLGLVVLVLGGLARHLVWFFIGGSLLVVISAYWIYRRFKKNRDKILQTVENLPYPRDGAIEIRILGGLLSFKFNRRGDAGTFLADGASRRAPQLEDPNLAHNRALFELVDLLEQNVITPAEFERAKKNLPVSE